MVDFKRFTWNKLLGCVLFGLVMGVRGEFQSIWMRTLLAACAAATLGLCFLPLRKER